MSYIGCRTNLKMLMERGPMAQFSQEARRPDSARQLTNDPQQRLLRQRFAAALRRRLERDLPRYMVPGSIQVLDSFPLSQNGKLDRRALPEPRFGVETMAERHPPQGDMEELLAGAWRSILRVVEVSQEDNFFELGGHSLLLVQLMESLRGQGFKLEARSAFENPTLASRSKMLRRDEVTPAPARKTEIPSGCNGITPRMLPLVALSQDEIDRIVAQIPEGAANVQDIYPLAPLQDGILFHHLIGDSDSDAYVLRAVLRLASKADVDSLIRALQNAIDCHDVLRTVILWENLNRPVQVVQRRASLKVQDLSEEDLGCLQHGKGEVRQGINVRLDLRLAPLMSLQLSAQRPSGETWAVLNIHHLVCDNNSLNALLLQVISNCVDGTPFVPSPISYRDHIAGMLQRESERDATKYLEGRLGDITEA